MNLKLPLWLKGLNPFRIKATKCGHRTKCTGKVSAFGKTATVEMPENSSGSVDYCLECLGKMAIRCAWCGDAIFIGEPVTLYTPNGDFQIPDYATFHNKNPVELIGCLGWDCAESGIDRAGFWLPGNNNKGFVEPVPSILQALFEGKVPSMTIIADTHDMAEAKNPKIIPVKGP